ncbi:MAG: hypothetical protein U0787_14850 [Polyangia bacterium]
MRIKTILLAVGLTWIAPLTAARTAPRIGPAVSNRPSLMPCRIVERIEGAPQIEKLYTLHYRRDGRLDRATQQTVLNRCVTVKCRFGDDDPVLEYQYDDEGRLISVKLRETAQVVSIKYLMGRLQEYERTANPHDDVFGESRTVVSPTRLADPPRRWVDGRSSANAHDGSLLERTGTVRIRAGRLALLAPLALLRVDATNRYGLRDGGAGFGVRDRDGQFR